MTTAAIEIRGLEKQLGTFHLGPLNLTVPTGSIYGFVGPNGAGKTTTLDLIMGMGGKDAGSISVFGMDHRRHEVDIKRRVGYVSPDLSYALWKQVDWLGDFVSRYYPTWDSDYYCHLLDQFGIIRNERIKNLSFGNKTKLAVAVALAHHPDLLLLDEPMIGVDAVSKKRIFTELLAAVQDEKRTILISSHDLTDLERFADHIGIIKNGRLLLEGSTTELVERFQKIDFFYFGSEEWSNVKGLHIETQQGNRWRGLVDQNSVAQAKLHSGGAQIVTTTPVSLEELFVALVEE